jgi:branched-chain amino acid transport system ATP-binding protein
MSVLLVEQDAQLALGISDYGYVIDEGEIRMEGAADELLDNGDVQEKYLKV